MVYKILQFIFKLYLPLFFKRVEVRGLKNIPKDKPVILAVNHQNTFLDAILVGIQLKRQVFFLTRSDVFKGGFARKILKGLNLIPIYRKNDNIEEFAIKNKGVFMYCNQQLENGKAILIFPEGQSEPIHHLFPLKKGVARLALEAEAAHNFNLRLHVVPVAVNYENHFLPGKKAFVEFLNPIIVSNYKSSYYLNPAKAKNELLQGIFTELKENVVSVEGDYVKFKRRYWKGILRHSQNDKEMIAALKAIPAEGGMFCLNDWSWRRERSRFLKPRRGLEKLFYFLICLPGMLLYLPTIFLSNIFTFLVKDKSFYLSIICVSWLFFGFIQSVFIVWMLWLNLDAELLLLTIILNFFLLYISLRNFNKFV